MKMTLDMNLTSLAVNRCRHIEYMIFILIYFSELIEMLFLLYIIFYFISRMLRFKYKW